MSQPYQSLEALLHDAFWEAEDGGSEIALMADFLKRHPGPALEIGAGSGRLMFPLVKMGFEVEGLELSGDMLALAETRAADSGIRPVMHHGDMTDWQDGRKFSSLLAPAFTLQLAGDPEKTLRHWHDLLEPGGALYLTVFLPHAELLGDLPEDEWYEDHVVTLPDGREGLLETCHRIDPERRILERRHRYSLSGEPPLTHESRQILRWFEHEELSDLLAPCGFQVTRSFADFDPALPVDNPDNDDLDSVRTYEAVRKDG